MRGRFEKFENCSPVEREKSWPPSHKSKQSGGNWERKKQRKGRRRIRSLYYDATELKCLCTGQTEIEDEPRKLKRDGRTADTLARVLVAPVATDNDRLYVGDRCCLNKTQNLNLFYQKKKNITEKWVDKKKYKHGYMTSNSKCLFPGTCCTRIVPATRNGNALLSNIKVF